MKNNQVLIKSGFTRKVYEIKRLNYSNKILYSFDVYNVLNRLPVLKKNITTNCKKINKLLHSKDIESEKLGIAIFNKRLENG